MHLSLSNTNHPKVYRSKIWCKIYRQKTPQIFLTIQSFIRKAIQGNAISSYGIPDVDGEDMFDPQYETDNQGIEVR